MKILVFVETFMYPTLTFVYNEVTELAKHHEVKVLCTRRMNEDDFPFDDVAIIPFTQNIFKEKILWYAEKFNFLMSRKNTQFRSNASKLINDYKPDIIH